MRKRGEFSLSFSLIFSIILIIAIVAIASYVTINFLRVGKCSEIGLYYNDLQEEVNEAWQSTIYRDIYSGKLPKSIENVCFGDLSSNYRGNYEKQAEAFKVFSRENKNVFLYPIQEKCSDLTYFKLEHVEINEFFCVNVVSGGVKINLEKTEFDALVTLGA